MTSREQIKDANVKNYDAETVSKFLSPNFLSSAKLSAERFLQFVPSNAGDIVERHDSKLYKQDDLRPFTGTIDNVNRDIWPAEGKALDFACGAGLLTNVLLDNIGKAVGVDVAPEMIKAFKGQVHDPRGEGHLIDILDKGNQTAVEKAVGSGFDCAVSTLAFHHIPDIQDVVQQIKMFVKTGGWVFSLDFDGHGLHDNDLARAKAKNDTKWLNELGIVEENMDPMWLAKSFKQAGLQNVTVERGFQLQMWFGDEASVIKFFNDDQKSTTETRVNENGVTEYMKCVTLAMVAGQVS